MVVTVHRVDEARGIFVLQGDHRTIARQNIQAMLHGPILANIGELHDIGRKEDWPVYMRSLACPAR